MNKFIKKFMKRYITIVNILFMIQQVAYAETDAPSVIQSKVGTIINVVAYFGYAIALGMLAYIAIKYMLSAASDRANLKQGVINYLIGAFLIAGASLVANAVAAIVGGSGDLGGMTDGIVNRYPLPG